MIGLPRGKIAVDPLFDKDTTESHNAFSAEEIEYLDREGIPHDQANDFKIPDSAIKKCDQGIIKYMHPDVAEEFDIHIGDWVLFSGYDGTTLRLEGEGLLILMKADQVKAIIREPATEVPGLFCFDGQEYFTATSEMAIDMISRTFEANGIIKSRPVTNG